MEDIGLPKCQTHNFEHNKVLDILSMKISFQFSWGCHLWRNGGDKFSTLDGKGEEYRDNTNLDCWLIEVESSSSSS
ncbi:hypothetical protein RJ641_016204 [Dillenia turbinata]|uniref:Uncharacterized protein n=1 Tax=Dillenia turbinata TaxID=194707 RepID=A0AAN8URB1_9MAGN